MEQKSNEIKFDGTGLELFKLYISNLLLTILTLGVYYFWAKVKIKKYFYNHTSFLDGRFGYHVTGKEKLMAFLKGILIVGVPFFLIMAGLPRLLAMAGVRNDWATAIPPLVVYLALMLLTPAIIYGSRKFQLARTSWNSVHFRFNGKVKHLYKIIFQGVFWSILAYGIFGFSAWFVADHKIEAIEKINPLFIFPFIILFWLIILGIYCFWFITKLQKYLIDKSAIGNQSFNFDGRGRDIFFTYLGAFIMVPLTLGYYFFVLRAELERYFWSHTSFQGNRFKSRMTAPGLFKKTMLGSILTVFTLGFGLPWAVVMLKKYTLETLALEGEVDLTSIHAAPDVAANALAEGVNEAGDFLEAFGDFFA